MKNGNLGGFLGGLVGLAVSVVVVGYAWRMSQSRKSGFIPGASSEPGAAPPLQPDFENPYRLRPAVDRSKPIPISLEDKRRLDLAAQEYYDEQQRRKMSRVMMSGDGFFDGVYN